MEKEKSFFEQLNSINVNAKVEQKNGLNYLSWAWAVQEFSKKYPDFTYEVRMFKDENGVERPYTYDPNTGYMVFTSVTAGGATKVMWLPVMDSANNAMKSVQYEVKTKYKTSTVAPATMFDINKTIMRCLVKNLAMFGLGLYIYAGEDLPEELDGDDEPKKEAPPAPKKDKPASASDSLCLVFRPDADKEIVEKVAYFTDALGGHVDKVLIHLNKKDVNDLTEAEIDNVIRLQKAGIAKRKELDAQEVEA